MAPANPATNNIPSDDDLDDILNGIVDGEDVFDTSNIQPRQESEKQQKTATANAALGIDEEIKIVKKRQPIPKLDENRLLSAAGIPKLRRIGKERLRFKGKGHEYGDITRMLNMYQLWLDDLYPRAKFADGLMMIEKLGHSKRIQYMRKEWIDEGRPKPTTEVDPEEDDALVLVETNGTDTRPIEGATPSLNTVEEPVLPTGEAYETPRQPVSSTRASGADEPNEDELDALLAEGAAPNNPLTSAVLPPNTASNEEDEFAEDMAAMADMEDMW
ncbi:Swi3-domain-containing protein [Zopfia rhizophila CBS 207.26]|uniref:Chromosome segregation in meiosis protein n=1 Tax=Zopfia rhizophila CBS 207.26 TaxID=1314779 RepID=A0A6A6DIW2_9PEZI|nr:Swi3-domain-containing protein [Zopfia rhizophila CBS 207.26]